MELLFERIKLPEDEIYPLENFRLNSNLCSLELQFDVNRKGTIHKNILFYLN
jgi:hypothetical protein